MTRPVRVEQDSLGTVEVPADVWWGAQTQRAVENFPVSGVRLERRLIEALALIKAESARVNAALDEVPRVDRQVGTAIATAADDVAGGHWDDQFPVDVFQTGSGTSSNMNANEVIAHIAAEHLGEPVHPNDQVNASQSSNDVFPTAVRMAALRGVTDDLLPALDRLRRALGRKQREFTSVVKAGRTHLMDATPMTLGQEFGGYAAQVRDARARIESCLDRVGAVPLGGTAVGTGINAPPTFGRRTVGRLARRTGLPLTVASSRFAAQGGLDALVELSGQLRTCAVSLMKIANDVRWLASGPHAGLGEIRLPELQPGSSIMPGKVNPVLCEVVAQVCVQVMGNDAAVGIAGSQGSFELNTYQPVVARNVLESIRLLANATTLFADRCVAGIIADVDTCRSYAEASPAVATALAPLLGYDVVADLVRRSLESGTSLRELVLEEKLLSRAAVDRALDLEAMTQNEG
jgi:fumarate hydratase class II